MLNRAFHRDADFMVAVVQALPDWQRHRLTVLLQAIGPGR
jgi:hypothetical protein